MEVINDSWSFITRHKRKFAIASIASLGIGGYILYKQVKPQNRITKLFQEQMKQMEDAMQDPEILKKQEQKRLQDRFAENMRTGDILFEKSVPGLKKKICELFDVNSLLESMKKVKGPKDDMWMSLKNLSFSRALLGLYMVVLQNTFLKIQISIASRYANSPDIDPKKCEEINKKYLDFIADYSHTIGIKKMSEAIYKIVIDVLEQKKKEDLPALITNNNLVEMLKEIRKKIEMFPKEENDPEVNTFVEFLLPPENLFDDVKNNQNQYQQMMIETNNIIKMHSFWQVINSCLDDSFNLLYDVLLAHSQTQREKQKRPKNHMIGNAIRFVDYIIFLSRSGFNSILPSKLEDISTLTLYLQLNKDKGVKDLCTVIFFPADLCPMDEEINEASTYEPDKKIHQTQTN